MISAQGLSKHFGPKLAVDGASFEARPGEVFGLLGENGAGKTTTLRMLATVLVPSAGTAQVAGFDVVGQPDEVRKRIGVLTGEAGLYDRLTARENVAYFGRLFDLEPAIVRRRTDELFEQLGISDEAERRVGGFSKGMKQKVCLARALVHDPPVLLLDEPTAGLDVTAARAVEEIIASLRARGKTIVFSSHVMSQVEKLCDRVAIIHRGRVVETGTVDEVRGDAPSFEDRFARLVGAAS